MYFPHNESDDPSAKTSASSAVHEDGSYEIVFDNHQNKTDYSTNGFNAYGFNANGSSKATPPEQNVKTSDKKKPSRGIVALFSITLALTVIAIALSLTALIMLKTAERPHAFGTKPNVNETLSPWQNPFPTAPTDAYAAATAKAIHSVVVITTDSGSGSGVVWSVGSQYSYIVTCNHVIEDAKTIKLTFHNEESAQAEIIGSDARTDIALLRIEKTDVLPIVLPNEKSTMALGQAVIAIGNPLGVFGNSVSDGILSSLTRTVSVDGSTMKLLQTTAAVNHGNSGGGLFDLDGQLIGLVNAKISETSVEGIGFAIPIETLKTVTAELMENGYVSGRPALGIEAVMIDSTEAYNKAITEYPDLENYVIRRDFFGNQIMAGLYVISADADSFADGAEVLKFGDRIAAIGTKTVSSASDIQSALNSYSAGDTVQITFTRSNKSYVTELILAEYGK